MATLFISDLHLHASRAAMIRAFVDFLAGPVREARALYILGDLFEVWIGDDHPEPAYLPVKQALSACTKNGTPVFVLHGNRDFLIGERFAAETGITLLPDQARIELDGMPTVLMHGDTLCTDDSDYQALRRQLRDPDWQRHMLALPVEERLEFAEKARALSREATRGKAESIMDVNAQAVREVFDDPRVELLIHGHTHRPGIHTLEHKGGRRRRVVLGDWYREASILSVANGRLDLGPVHTTRIGP